MTRLLAAVSAFGLLAGSLVAVEDPPIVTDPVAALIAQLGHDDYLIREDAERRLSELGPEAIPALRVAAASENPEVSRRAERAMLRIQRRTNNDKLLAPKLVTLSAVNIPLDRVLADLSKQSDYEVVLGATATDAIASRLISVQTGQVPFWQAVLAVCEAGDLKITSAGGFLASDTPRPQPQTSRPTKKASRPATNPNQSVVLEPRGDSPRRSAAVHGALCIESVPVPDAVATPEASVAILQVWPEPGLQWQAASAIRLDRAVDDAGQARLTEPSGPAFNSPQVMRGNNVVVVNQVNGGVVLVNPNARVPSDAAGTPNFTPNARQFVVKLKPAARPARVLSEFRGTLFGTIRVGPEPMIVLADLLPGQTCDATHPDGADLRVNLRKDVGGKWRATVDLSYDTLRVQPADAGGKLGNTIQGIRVTDANGNAYLTVPNTMSQTFRGNASRPAIRMDCELLPAKTQSGPPSAVTFWATFGKSVEVPFALVDVPVAGGAK